MHPSERLAAFLAGELTRDEHRALEAELARDVQLRAQLAAMRRADAALSAVSPAALPDGARTRLLDTLTPTLAEQLGTAEPVGATGVAGSPGPADELAARRARTSRRRTWVAAAGGVAAAALAVAVIAPDLGGSRGGTDSAGESAEVQMDAADESAAGAAEDAAGTFASPSGPVLTGGDRPVDAAAADELLASPELDAVIDRDLDAAAAADLSVDWATALGASSVAAGSAPSDAVPGDGEATAEGETATEEEATTESAEATPDAPERDTDRSATELMVGPDVDDAGRADVGRCLDVLLTTGDTVVPATAELVTFDGEPAIAYGLVGLGPDGTVSRREVWVLARETCEVRYFTQS